MDALGATFSDRDTAQSRVTAEGRVLHLQVMGCVKLWGGERALATRPQLRKATAILAVLALADNHEITRRQIAKLLWSRNSAAEGLARLRDTLHRLRRAIELIVPGLEILQFARDQVVLHRESVWVDIFDETALGRQPFAAEDVASDLNGIDPMLDTWLAKARLRLQAKVEDMRPAAIATPAPLRSGPTIGVSPLAAIGPGIEPALPLAMASEITAALTGIRWLVVLPSAALAAMHAQGGPLHAYAGLDFVLEGSLQRVDSRIRVCMSLIDVQSGAVAWSWRSAFETNDMLALQEDAAAMLSAAVEPEIAICEAARARRQGNTGKGAYTLVLQAASCIYRLEYDSFIEGGRLISEAIDAEPFYGAAHSWRALWNVFLVGQGWAKEPTQSIAEAERAAERAIMLDPGDARGLAVAGHVQAFLHRRLDMAHVIHERAVTINPNLPIAWQLGGVAHAYAGNVQEAKLYLKRSHRLAPVDPHSFFQDGCCLIVELISGNFAAARATGQRVTQLHPNFSAAYKPYLAALGHLGEMRLATSVRAKLLELEPNFSLENFSASAPFARAEHMEIYLTGLRNAGVS